MADDAPMVEISYEDYEAFCRVTNREPSHKSPILVPEGSFLDDFAQARAAMRHDRDLAEKVFPSGKPN